MNSARIGRGDLVAAPQSDCETRRRAIEADATHSSRFRPGGRKQTYFPWEHLMTFLASWYGSDLMAEWC
jgi:hypothetical protein